MPVLLNGDGKKNDVATVAKYWWACRVDLGHRQDCLCY